MPNLLFLTLIIGANELQFIREEKFGDFLRSDKRNILQVHANSLNCNDKTPYLWLLQNRSEYENRVQHAFCSDSRSIWDLITCQIDGNDLKCDANYQTFNITAEIEFLSQTLPEDQKRFENLIIKRANIEEIPENVFQDISFNYVQIYNANNLKRIHTNAFNNNTAFNLRKQLYISLPNQLRNDPPDYDFWKAFSSLVYIKDLEISLADGSHEIPDNAFVQIYGPQNDLSYVVFDKNNFEITRIGNYAFAEIPNLSILSFHDILIGSISANAFDFKNNSTQTLNINLLNCGLTETSLEEGVFSDAKRPLTLDLSMN
jgi:hypothetical protein